MLTQKAKYSLHALFELASAAEGEMLQISDIAERQGIPKKFLEAILLDLKRHGIVRSRRGPGGGYALLRPPSQVTFGQVLRSIDGPLAPVPCLSRTAYRRCRDCKDEEASCPIRRVLAVTHEATARFLDRTSLADALSGAVDHRGFEIAEAIGPAEVPR